LTIVNPFFMHLFYHPYQDNSLIQFEEEESLHLKVLRAKEGDEIFVINGAGDFATAKIQSIQKRTFVAEIISIEKHQKRDAGLHIAVAPLKQMDRIELMLEKVCELGIEQISFISTKRTERDKLNFERLNKIIQSACKQSKNFWFPKFNTQIVNYDAFMKSNQAEKKLIAYCGGRFSGIEQNLIEKENTIILIGPEGDFTDEEYQMALQNNYSAISLGNTRLRTETAAIYVTAAFKFVNRF
jgi:16S rRNA (uracil1498-N3)-methyltransferase